MYQDFNSNAVAGLQLVEGLNCKSRPSGKVHTVKKEDGWPVAEVVVGVRTIRMNLRSRYEGSENLKFTGHSTTWLGGGVIVTAKNFDVCRKVLVEIAGLMTPVDEVGGEDLHSLEEALVQRLTVVVQHMHEIDELKNRIANLAGIEVKAA